VSLRIEDYALIGDRETAALVGCNGSIDWLCLPRFDSGACFAALLGTEDNGRWLLAPKQTSRHVRRRYRPNTLILETEFQTNEGAVIVVDFMPLRTEYPVVVRQVQGKYGRVAMNMELALRFDYGWIVPWVRRIERGIRAIAGPDTVLVCSDVELRGENFTTVADFSVSEGEKVSFALSWHPSHNHPGCEVDPERALAQTQHWWEKWSARCTYEGPWRADVMRSLITLNALIDSQSGGIVAAPTTSLPEHIGSVRNWDYRYCWLRDATFTLYSLVAAGYKAEAQAWREWLIRAVAGKPEDLQIMYGLAGERRLTEFEIPWLSGYENSKPVRVGNAASGQFQLDVYGELFDAALQSRRAGLAPLEEGQRVIEVLLNFLETAWKKPDDGIWEVRGPRRHFTHSKVMAWVAMDRAVKLGENFGLRGPIERWRGTRDTIHAQVCREGFNTELNSFVQYYGSSKLDASLLMIPLVGFLPPEDPRVRGTVAAIEGGLMKDGFVLRYIPDPEVESLPPGEGAFLPCTFWLADNLYLIGRRAEAKEIFERLLSLRNDVGLLSEEYDPHAKRLLGNFPQAFSHVGLVNTAINLSPQQGPAEHRALS
jgi:GH15 family glucan-1,4-alpha-glucosidase